MKKKSNKEPNGKKLLARSPSKKLKKEKQKNQVDNTSMSWESYRKKIEESKKKKENFSSIKVAKKVSTRTKISKWTQRFRSKTLRRIGGNYTN